MRIIVVALLIAALPMVGHSRIYECQHASISSRYDSAIKTAGRRHLPAPYTWCELKAQCTIESNLNPDAESPAGAHGLCQLLVGTAEEVGVKRSEIRNPKRNAEGAARYMAKMLAFWSTPRPAECRLELALASYNAGAGNVLKAQAVSGGRTCWDLIGPELHKVTGDHAVETNAYVLRFWATRRKLIGAGL